jgi:predicted acetyltransferase
MPFSVRVGEPGDIDQVIELLFTAFHERSDDMAELERMVFEPQRSLVAHDEGELVGHTGAFTRDLEVPGGTIPAGFVTMVGVAGTHRRKGIASEILTRQLGDIRDSGEPAAVLWASEGRIYQRFGYGLASRRMGLSIDTREVRLTRPPAGGRVRAGLADTLRKDLFRGYPFGRAGGRPGYASRTETWWDFLLADKARQRQGAGPLRAIVYDGPSGVEGYALYRVQSEWDTAGPKGEVKVQHTVASTPEAYAELWRFLLGIDLTRTVSLVYGSVDEPLFDMVNEPRQLSAHVVDGLWLRVVDVPSALRARAYPSHQNLVIEVKDDLFEANTGRFDLSGARVTAPADVALDISALGALYLGGGSAAALCTAGRLTELRPGGLAAAHSAFTWPLAPTALEMF